MPSVVDVVSTGNCAGVEWDICTTACATAGRRWDVAVIGGRPGRMHDGPDPGLQRHRPREHRPRLRSTNPLERVNKEIGRRSDVAGIYPNDQSLIRLAGMLLVEQAHEWLVQRRDLFEHSIKLVISGPAQTWDIMTRQNDDTEVTELAA